MNKEKYPIVKALDLTYDIQKLVIEEIKQRRCDTGYLAQALLQLSDVQEKLLNAQYDIDGKIKRINKCNWFDQREDNDYLSELEQNAREDFDYNTNRLS